MSKRICSYPNCGNPYEAKGLCGGHYMQRRRGRELTPLGAGVPISDRLDANSKTAGDCLVWTGKLSSGGYGQIRWDGGRWYAHRAAYVAAHGSIPDSMQVNHICGDRACIKVSHLELVTHQQNVQYLTRLSSANTSGYRGVSLNKDMGRYKAQVVAGGVSHHLGYYTTAEEAAKVAADGRAQLHSMPDFNVRVASLKAPGGGSRNG